MPTLPNTLAEISHLSYNKNPVFPPPLSNAAFTLDSSGVAGFFGGDSSVAGMATANLIPGRRWVGWFNTPGSYEIAKQYGPLAQLKMCDGLFPQGDHDPARLFRLDGMDGPQFVAIHSGTVLQRTGHLGHLITNKAEGMKSTRERFEGTNGRTTTCPSVTIVDLRGISSPKEWDEPRLPESWTAAWSLAPMLVSGGACVTCALVADWFCFASIAVGIVAHGLACYAIGSGKLTFQHPQPAETAPHGDGVLKGDKSWVILLGSEGVVNSFTRGRVLLRYGNKSLVKTEEGVKARKSMEKKTEDTAKLGPSRAPWSWIPPQWFIGPCALLLMGQFLVQLLLIPLGTLFGQLMFISTLVASWLYNTYLSSIDREEILMKILNTELYIEDNRVHKYELSTFTAAVAFTCFVFASVHHLHDPRAFLDAMIPNKTIVWEQWKTTMAARLQAREHFDAPYEGVDFDERDRGEVDAEQQGLLHVIFCDTKDAWDAWRTVRDSGILPPSVDAKQCSRG